VQTGPVLPARLISLPPQALFCLTSNTIHRSSTFTRLLRTSSITMEQPGNTKTAPKSGAQRNAKYVARQKAKDPVPFNKKQAQCNAEYVARQKAKDPVAFNKTSESPPAGEYRPDDEHAGLTDTEQEGNTDTRINANWKRGTPIKLPLTEDRRKYSFNMDEGVVLSTYAHKLCHEAIEEYIPAVERKDGLGGVLNQLRGALPPKLWSDLWYIYKGRVGVQHLKWSFELEEPHKYEAVMKRVIYCLCPNWELEHYNAGARRLERKMDQEIAYLRCQLRKRGRVYEDGDHDEVGFGGRSAKRAREYY
jgi:hypothetical protein